MTMRYHAMHVNHAKRSDAMREFPKSKEDITSNGCSSFRPVRSSSTPPPGPLGDMQFSSWPLSSSEQCGICIDACYCVG